MRRNLLLIVFAIWPIAANATKYQVTYDILKQRPISFIINLETNQFVVGNRIFPYRKMGIITNQGIIFDSYAFGRNGALCVSRTTIKVKKDVFTTLSGYVIIVNKRAFLAVLLK